MLISKNGYQIRNPHGQKPLSTGFSDFQNLPIFTEKFAGRVNWNSAGMGNNYQLKIKEDKIRLCDDQSFR